MKLFKTFATATAVSALLLTGPALAQASVSGRIAGADRYDTSLQIAQHYFPQAKTVFLATGKNFPDALAAGPYAAKEKAPILLVGDKLTPAQMEYLNKVRPEKAVLFGGSRVVTTDIEKALKSIGKTEVSRIAGADRFETAKMIAEKMGKTDQVFVATGLNFPDALAGGAYAARLGKPLVLAGPNHPFTTDAKATLLGGPAVLADGLVKSSAGTTRIFGADRFDTAAKIAALKPAAKAFLAYGLNFPDALAAVPAAGVSDQPLLLAKTTCSPLVPAVPVTLIGGTGVLSDSADKACVSAHRQYTYKSDGSNGKNAKLGDLISFETAVKTVRAYYGAGDNGIANKTSSRYIDDVTSITKEAAPRLAKACAKAKSEGKKPAAVFDADDTTLWTYDMEDAAMGFVFTPDKQQKWFDSNMMPATPGMVSLVRQLHDSGCQIIGLTGRNDAQKDYTVSNLKHAGYLDKDGKPLFVKEHYFTKFLSKSPMPDYLKAQGRCDVAKNKCSTVQYKAGVRQYLEEKQGYTIVANVGDQWSDLMGGYSGNWVKLPNPMYYLPSPNNPDWAEMDAMVGMQPEQYTWSIALDGSTGAQAGIKDYQIPNIDIVKAALKAQGAMK